MAFQIGNVISKTDSLRDLLRKSLVERANKLQDRTYSWILCRDCTDYIHHHGLEQYINDRIPALPYHKNGWEKS